MNESQTTKGFILTNSLHWILNLVVIMSYRAFINIEDLNEHNFDYESLGYYLIPFAICTIFVCLILKC